MMSSMPRAMARSGGHTSCGEDHSTVAGSHTVGSAALWECSRAASSYMHRHVYMMVDSKPTTRTWECSGPCPALTMPVHAGAACIAPGPARPPEPRSDWIPNRLGEACAVTTRPQHIAASEIGSSPTFDPPPPPPPLPHPSSTLKPGQPGVSGCEAALCACWRLGVGGGGWVPVLGSP